MTSYSCRRKLTRDELVPAIAAGAGLGLGVAAVTAYLTQMFLRRTPLRAASPEVGGAASGAGALERAGAPKRRGRVAP